jgi:predicted enzyme related to lactoylglutathione lyase
MTDNTKKGSFDYIEFPTGSAEGLKKTKAFYSSVFGWVYKDWGPEYSDTSDGVVGSGLNADPAHRTNHPLAIIHVPNIEKARDEVVAAGGKITREIFEFPGGRRFHFIDPVGNELGIWSE